jgi:hypothetical protein
MTVRISARTRLPPTPGVRHATLRAIGRKALPPDTSRRRISIPVLTGKRAAWPHTDQWAEHPKNTASDTDTLSLPNFAKGGTIQG